MISALGHAPVRFEDFTALPVPPRQACLDALAASDVYLLILGSRYGDLMPDTGLAPTEEEFTAARAKRMPIIVMKKETTEFETAQADFVDRIGAYVTGRFRNTFSSTPDLLTKTAAAIRLLADQPARVEVRNLEHPIAVAWLGEAKPPVPARGFLSTTLEVHLLPVRPARLPAAALEEGPRRLATIGREGRLFSDDQGLKSGGDSENVWIVAAEPRRQGAGIRISRSNTVSVWRELPRDNLGTILAVRSLSADIADLVRLGGNAVAFKGDVTATAALDPVAMAVEGDPADLGRRTSANLTRFATGGYIRLPPETAVSAESLDAAAQDLARELAVRLIREFRG